MSLPLMSGHDRLSLLAPAKINLSLHVRGRLADGYHALESLVAFADIGDRLDFEIASDTGLTLSGPFDDEVAFDDNLVLQAHAALVRHIDHALPCHIGLQKNLPVASGIGGGSADAAATLNGLNRLFDLRLTPDVLSDIAATLGADVPVCLAPAPAWMTGIGHEVTRLPALPQADVVLVNPMQGVSTPQVFEALAASPELTPPQPVPAEFVNLASLIDFLNKQGNTLAAPAIELVPNIADCLVALTDAGAMFAAMSGSGATCFALAPEGEGGAIAARYREFRSQDWVQAGHLLTADVD